MEHRPWLRGQRQSSSWSPRPCTHLQSWVGWRQLRQRTFIGRFQLTDQVHFLLSVAPKIDNVDITGSYPGGNMSTTSSSTLYSPACSPYTPDILAYGIANFPTYSLTKFEMTQLSTMTQVKAAAVTKWGIQRVQFFYDERLLWVPVSSFFTRTCRSPFIPSSHGHVFLAP